MVVAMIMSLSGSSRIAVMGGELNLLNLEESGDTGEQVLAEGRVRTGQVGVVARFHERGEEGRDGFGERVVERGRVAQEERVESEPVRIVGGCTRGATYG